MTFADLINRLMALRLNLKENYWLEFKFTGYRDFFSVSIGHFGFNDYKNHHLIYCKKLSKLVPQEAWNEINSTCQSGFVKEQKDLFNTQTERKEQSNA